MRTRQQKFFLLVGKGQMNSLNQEPNNSEREPSAALAHLSLDAVLQWIPAEKRDEVRQVLLKRAVDQAGGIKVSWALLAAGDHFYGMGAYDRARVCYMQMLDMTVEREERSRAHFGIGNTYQLELDPLKAREAYRQALSEANSPDLTGARAEVLNQLANVERSLGEVDSAQEHSQQSLAANIAANRSKGAARAAQGLSTLAAYFDAMGRRADAKYLLIEAIASLGAAASPDEFSEAISILESAQELI